jgi:hypothetical protein
MIRERCGGGEATAAGFVPRKPLCLDLHEMLYEIDLNGLKVQARLTWVWHGLQLATTKECWRASPVMHAP